MNEKNLTPKEKIASLKRGYKMCGELAPGGVKRKCANSALSVISGYVGIAFSGAIVDVVTGGSDLSYAVWYAVIFAAVMLIRGILDTFLYVSKAEQLDRGFEQNAKMLIAKKCMELDYVRIENPETHRLKERAETYLYGNGSRWNGLGRLYYDTGIIIEAVTAVIAGVVMCFKPLFLTPPNADGFMWFVQSLWGLLTAAVLYGTVIFIYIKVSKHLGKVWSAYFADERNNQVQRVLGFYEDFHKNKYQRGKDIRIYDQSEMLEKEWGKYCGKELEINRGIMKKSVMFDWLAPLFMTMILAITYSLVIARAAGGQYTAAEATVLVMSISKLMDGVTTILGYKVDFFDLAPMNITHIYNFLDIPCEKYMGTIPTEKRDDNEYEFEFKHVYFKYPGSEQYVLRDINLKWRIGEKMALVGRNGSGKSTLVKLLCRLYDPTEGNITLNGIDIKKYNYDEYMALFSVVFQDSKLFSFSIAENVAADMDYDPSRAEDCVRRAGLSERLDNMPEGIKTFLYKDFDENGVEISGGEAQKLCLARAVYKGSPFIVLDEPTAALDPISEHDVYTNFNSIVGTRTAVYISHRLSSCKFCDDITVLDKGEIAERGSHESLLSAGGVYAKMWAAQAEYYKNTAGKLYD